MKASLAVILTLVCLTGLLVPHYAQDTAASAGSSQGSGGLHPAVALERRIVELIDALGITGEQEPSFRVVMQQLQDLELLYYGGETHDVSVPKNDVELLVRKEALLARVLYPTQVEGFRAIELERAMNMRGQ